MPTPRGRTAKAWARMWTRGALTIAVLAAVWLGLQQLVSWLQALFPEPPSTVAALGGVLVVPVVVGWIMTRFVHPSFRRYKGAEAIVQWENRLVKEFSPDDARGFQVAIVAWPNAEVRTMGVITGTIDQTDSDNSLVAVFIPNSPEPTGGLLRVVHQRDIELTEWNLKDLFQFQVSLGSNTPAPVGNRRKRS